VLEIPLTPDEQAAFRVSIDHVRELVQATEKLMAG